jgi:insulysin
MCFLGSVKYPGENEYKSYLAQHGGRSNASTSMHLTTYKFEILAEYAEHALDLFSNFFTDPLFTSSGTGREVNAVDSENSKNLTADVRRRLQILKDIGDPNHYYTKFSTGNASTLPTSNEEQLHRVREALLAFHRRHYRPENLTVVVAGPQPLDQLQDWVIPRFGTMLPRPFPLDPKGIFTSEETLVETAASAAPPFGHAYPEPQFSSAFLPDLQGSWPVLLTVKPVRSMRKLVLLFPVPPVMKVPDQSPLSVLSHLLGHEGPNSPFAVLQNMGLLSSLSAGPRVSAPDFSLFQIDMSLTIEGERRWKEVIEVIFQHCRLIVDATANKVPELQRIWAEKATLGAMNFDQTSPGDVYSLAPSLSNSIVTHGTERSISAGSMLEESKDTFPLRQVSHFASLLVPTNCIIERCGESAWEEMERIHENDFSSVHKKREQWYGIDYFLSAIDRIDALRWEQSSEQSQDLALPKKNEFIPRSLELCEELPEEARQGPRIDRDINPPNLIVDIEDVGRLWHRLDDRYALPKSALIFLFRNAAVGNIKVYNAWQHDVDAFLHSSLLDAMFSEAMAQETYMAELAGLSWSVSSSQSGLKFSFSGFSDRLSDLSAKVLREYVSGDFIQDQFFLSCKDRMLRGLRTYFESRRADSISLYYRDFLLSSEDFGFEEAIAYVENATLQSVKKHHGLIVSNSEARVDCLYSGNVSKEAALSFFMASSDLLVAAAGLREKLSWYPGERERRVPCGTSFELHFTSRNKQEENGAVVMTYQSQIPGFRGPDLSSKESLYSSAAVRLLCHMLREPLFDELRTKQALGYIVNSYHEIGFSTRPCTETDSTAIHWSIPVDFINISILSRKLAPPDVMMRIDDFLSQFRETLASMPESQIQEYASSLSAILLKPTQKLGTEASMQFSKIHRYAPQVLASSAKESIPWDNSKLMATTIRSLTRQALLEAWDRIMLPASRARVVSCVYGTTFPLDKSQIVSPRSGTKVFIDSLSDIIELRTQLPAYGNSVSPASMWRLRSFVPRMPSSPLGLAALIGVGAIATGWTIMTRAKKTSK